MGEEALPVAELAEAGVEVRAGELAEEEDSVIR